MDPRNSNGRNLKGKLEFICLQQKKEAFLVARKVWGFGAKGWKYAVERVGLKPKHSSIDSGKRNNFARGAAEKNSRQKAQTVKQKEASKDDEQIEVRKPQPPPRLLPSFSPFKMYCSCMGIVSLWILTGTFFYSYTNEWPVPQSFFYAVDAGMSIGFCTDVAETKLVSKAFTIVYIIMGASVVGGALALFIQDIVEGVVERERKNNSMIFTKEYELMLGKKAFEELDVSRNGSLTKDEFGRLLKSTITKCENSPATKELSDEDIDVLWTKFDRIEDGAIRFEEFEGTYRGIEGLLDSLLTADAATAHTTALSEKMQAIPSIRTFLSSLACSVSSFARPLLTSENRIYFVFLAWVLLGIVWGMLDQGWDPITATHFSISALATGGLTAPPVNSNGILPAEPSIFCGFYCLFGIPLMAITFGHFARILVSDHVAAMEKWALTRPITATDYEIAKNYLINLKPTRPNEHSYHPAVKAILRKGRQPQETPSSSPSWRGLHLSDFIVLQIFRQGRISVETINILRKEFELLDTDKTGLLTLEDATNWCTVNNEPSQE